jgi:hypothetical protein
MVHREVLVVVRIQVLVVMELQQVAEITLLVLTTTVDKEV